MLSPLSNVLECHIHVFEHFQGWRLHHQVVCLVNFTKYCPHSHGSGIFRWQFFFCSVLLWMSHINLPEFLGIKQIIVLNFGGYIIFFFSYPFPCVKWLEKYVPRENASVFVLKDRHKQEGKARSYHWVLNRFFFSICGLKRKKKIKLC